MIGIILFIFLSIIFYIITQKLSIFDMPIIIFEPTDPMLTRSIQKQHVLLERHTAESESLEKNVPGE